MGPADGAYLEQSDPLHRLRRPHRRPLPLLPADPEVLGSPFGTRGTSATWTACSTPTPSWSPVLVDFFRDRSRRTRGRLATSSTARRSRPRRSTPAPGHPAGGVAVEPRHLRHGPGATSRCCCGCGRTRCRSPASYADLMLTELRKVIPTFLKRVDLDDRGVALDDLPGVHPHGDGGRWPAGCSSAERRRRPRRPSAGVQLLDLDPDGEIKHGRRDALPVHARAGGADRGAGAADDASTSASSMLRGLRRRPVEPAPQARAGLRAARRTGSTCWPTTAPSATSSATCMLTIEWQALSPRHGYTRPRGRRPGRDRRARFDEAMERLGVLHDALAERFPAAGRLRGVAGLQGALRDLHLNAREAMHLLELRTTPGATPPTGWWARRCIG